MRPSELYIAICRQDLDKVRYLLESQKYSPNGDDLQSEPSLLGCKWLRRKSSSTYTPPLIQCIDTTVVDETRRLLILNTLLQHGGDINIRSNGWYEMTPAMKAAGADNIRCLQTLHEAGADLNITTRDGTTALSWSIRRASVACMRYLAAHVPFSTLNRQDIYGNTPLMEAAKLRGQWLCILETLLEAGVDLDRRNKDGHTALTIAVRECNPENVLSLLRSGAHIDPVTDSGRSLLSSSVIRRPGSVEIFTDLLRYGVDPNLLTRDRDLLHRMVFWRRSANVRALVQKGVPPMDVQLRCWRRRREVEYRYPSNKPPISPLAVALLCRCPDIANYFIANRFFTKFDVTRLYWDREIRRSLRKTWSTSALEDTLRKKSVEILDFLCDTPPTLVTLSLVAVSSALTQDITREFHDLADCTSTLHSRPSLSFKERVRQLELPWTMKAALLHDSPSTKACCGSWSDIPLSEHGFKGTVCTTDTCVVCRSSGGWTSYTDYEGSDVQEESYYLG